MASRHDEVFDPTKPALIVTCGNTRKNFRPLDRDIIFLGSAQGCDIALDAVGMLPVHSVIVRREGGFFIRNCAGHGGTRLNGESILEAPLHDADALQVGSFSFQVHIPAGSLDKPRAGERPTISDQQLRHVCRSRRHLARLALTLRERVRGSAGSPVRRLPDQGLAARQAELGQREQACRGQLRELEQRALTLKDAERQLAADREVLERARAAHQQRVQETEQGLAQRQGALEAEFQSRAEQFQRAEQAQRAEQPSPAATARVSDPEPVRCQKDVEELQGQIAALRQDLDQKNAFIQRVQAELASRPAAPTAARDIEGFEAELNHFQQQLEAERGTLDEEARQLQERRLELDDAVRETELELSRERAQLARDRVQLERLREEIRVEQERLGRDSELDNRLAACQRLREPEPH